MEAERIDRARRRPTAVDVARLSGVSRATVSYVLNDVANQTISEATKQRVRAAAAELGYSPSAVAAALRRGHSNIVLVVRDAALSGYITEPFLDAISARLREAGYSPLVHTLADEATLVELAEAIHPFGVVALARLTRDVSLQLRASGVKRQYHSISLDSDASPRPWEEEIGALQATHLVGAGVARLAYAHPEPHSARAEIAASRALGARRAAARAGLPELLELTVPTRRTEALDAVRPLLTVSETERIGVCAFDDTTAAAVLAAATDSGVAVPGALAVVGVDDTPFAALMSPALSSVAVDSVASGRDVAERFLSQDDQPATSRRSTPARIVRRLTS
ncbi:LacI family DNA-binding transcriptional regulator [Microbacterium marinilacus]|uniref:LacI family DNA-binding transcriptional regulator n=1 Tax=Microbacterium marinilacus TaxID=415209 RepID=A0ABP7BPC6_9MICO|nr:LacI family DNA-binding transcriptional regulator [Microbacterium marinilacus]MBY0690423.1 LacI family transcriptional regulator [Microbacterium marinilacus]